MSYSELDQAKHDTVEQHKGGAVALAPLIGIKSSTLSNKVNPNVDTHHLSLDEAVGIMAITQNYSMLKAAAATLDHAVIEIPTADIINTSDLELLDCWASWQADCGETATAIREALADSKITKKELQKIKREMFEDMAREFELLQRLEAICDER